MSSTEENVELIELRSSSSTKSYIKSKLGILDNKVTSSPKSSPAHNSFKENNENYNRTPPIKPPRRFVRKYSKTNTELSSDSQDELTDLKEYTESGPSSKLESGSYRERFKERFEQVKKQAGKSVSKANTFKLRSDKVRILKRSINTIKRENYIIDSELRNYESNKNCYDNNNFITSTEANSFFCEENNVDEKEAPEIAHESALTKSTDVLIDVTDVEENIIFNSPKNLQFNIKLSENELFWKPSKQPLEISEKIEGSEPRFLSEEGVYVKKPPNIPSSHINILERRLLGLNDKRWFNCEGQLDFIEAPTNDFYNKPPLYEKDSEIEAKYAKPTVGYPSKSEYSLNSNILDVSILAVRFKHHPLFSLEHVFVQKLTTFFDSYKKIVSEKEIERISKRLNALRRTKNAIYAENNADELFGEIKETRELYFKKCQQLRTLLKSILQTWTTIKKIRQSNEFSNTAVQLVITKIKKVYSNEKEEWDNDIDLTTKEIIEEMEKDYEYNMMKYSKALDDWKLQDGNIKKPKKPTKHVHEEIIKNEVTETFMKTFKPPGEPVVKIDINYDHQITAKVDNAKEKLRRNVVNSTKIYLRVLCDKLEVCKSNAVPLSDQFVSFTDEYFSILLTTIPDNIVIEIYEQPNALPKRKLGQVKVRVPKKNLFSNIDRLNEFDFVKEEIVHYKHSGVGSGVELGSIANDYSGDDEILYTSGVLTCKVEWDLQTLTNGLQDESRCVDVEHEIQNEDGTLNINKLISWANETKPDPEDPKHSMLYDYVRKYGKQTFDEDVSGKNYFRKDPDMKPLEFCGVLDLEKDLRLRLLELRNRNEPEFVGRIIPNNSKEIPENALEDYNRRIAEERVGLFLDVEDYDDEVDQKRMSGRKYLKQVYTKVFQQCRNMNNNLVYEDVVDEKIIPRIQILTKNILSNIISWIQFRPTKNIFLPLTTKKKVTKIGDVNAPVKIKIDVMFAINVPRRNNVRIEQTENSQTTVCPFVAVTYQNVTIQTSTGNDQNPIWNEELLFSLDSSDTNYLSPNSLSGSIVLRLFDEISVKVRQEYVKTKIWLGSIDVPISSIANSVKMEGLFRLQKPSNLLGYENFSSEDAHTYLSLRIRLEPNVPKLTQSMEELETTELSYIKQHILDWNESFNNDYPHRKFSALAIDINGKTTCVTRYIKPLEPPHLNTDRFVVSSQQCARYVAMIPFTDSNKFYQNVWLTTEQLLKFMIGSVIDHAVALVCYLTYLDIQCWLLLGYGLPHGTTAYVLVREYSRESEIPRHFIYDIIAATKYNVLDEYCPLQKVFCVINDHNVWANIQRTNQVRQTHFDFTVRMDWCQLFENQITAPTHSTQIKLNYVKTPDIHQLELKLDRKIRKKITKIRTHEKTTWNYNISKRLKSEINKLETTSMAFTQTSKTFSDLYEISSDHLTNGFVLNLPYTNISTIVANVVSTGAHLYQGINVEFSLTVQIYCYPNHVLSVWVCLVVLNPK